MKTRLTQWNAYPVDVSSVVGLLRDMGFRFDQPKVLTWPSRRRTGSGAPPGDAGRDVFLPHYAEPSPVVPGPAWTLSRADEHVRPVLEELFRVFARELDGDDWELTWGVSGPQGRFRGVASVEERATRKVVRVTVRCPGFRDDGKYKGFWRRRQINALDELDDAFLKNFRTDLAGAEEMIGRYLLVKDGMGEGRRTEAKSQAGSGGPTQDTAPRDCIEINRAPVLTLWGAVVADRLGYDPETSLTLGKCLAGLNAQAKGKRLGIYRERLDDDDRPVPKAGLGEAFWIELCGRALPAKQTRAGVRAVVGERAIGPASVQKYLETKFGDDLVRVREAMEHVAASLQPEALNARSWALYETFRPAVPNDLSGWGAKAALDLDLVRSLAGEQV